MPKITYSRNANAGELSVSFDKTITADNVVNTKKRLDAAKTGILSTRTDNNTGTLTMDAGHGLTTGQKVCIFFSGGVRYDVTLGTVSVNSVPFDLGGGTDLPLVNSAVTVMVISEETSGWALDADNLQGLLIGADAGPFIVIFYEDDGGAVPFGVYWSPNAGPYGFVYDADEQGALSAEIPPGWDMNLNSIYANKDIVKIGFAHGNPTQAVNISAAAAVD